MYDYYSVGDVRFEVNHLMIFERILFFQQKKFRIFFKHKKEIEKKRKNI